MRRLRSPSLESLFIAALVLFGYRLGVRPISDNSMLTHLRTGIDMVRGAGIPRADPYSYTAGGVEWTVQSWLPAWTYGWAHRLGGFRLVVLEQAVLFALLAWLVARLARGGSPLRTALAASVAIAIGAPFWQPRPLMFGLICMAVTVVVVDRRLTPWLLVPVVWVWVNSHGSFPLGLVWLGMRAAGEVLDWRTWPRESMRYVWAFLGSLGVATLNPLGSDLLLFPFTLGEKQEIFSGIVEWQSPDFQSFAGRFALVFLVVALALFARARLAWRDVVVVVGFTALALTASRNLAVLAIVFAPVLGRAVRRPDSAAPRPPPTPAQVRINGAVLAVLAATFAVFTVSVWATEPLSLDGYPVEAVAYLDENGLLVGGHRLAHQDFVGNYLILRFGRDARVFVDDRYDMYPLEVSSGYRELLRGGPGWQEVLDRHRVDVVLWNTSRPLASILSVDPRWREVFQDGDWVVLRRER
jgi:hypothetical protein